jgi:Xaa-Pro aminopeptidase
VTTGTRALAARIPRDEYERRWATVQAAARQRGLDGLVVWSRGGAMTDSYADVLYLSNHYSQFPLIGDVLPHWSGRSHSAVVLPLDREPVLVSDQPDWRRDLVAVDDVRFGLDVPATVAAVVAEVGLADRRLALVAGNAMLAGPYRRLVAGLADADLEPADELVELVRARKSALELDLLRETAAVGNQVVERMIEAALRPGTTEAEAVAAGYAVAITSGVATYDAAVASGPNSDFYAYGRLPSWTTRALEAGDFFHVDTYGALDGYLYDFARCCVVGGRPSPAQVEVLEAAVASVTAGVDRIRPGVRAHEVHAAVRSVLAEREMLPAGEGDLVSALTTSFPAHGHSFGLGWERPWLLPDEQYEIHPGMCFGIEAMAGRPGVGSAKFEQDLLVLDDGIELLTTTPTHYW